MPMPVVTLVRSVYLILFSGYFYYNNQLKGLIACSRFRRHLPRSFPAQPFQDIKKPKVNEEPSEADGEEESTPEIAIVGELSDCEKDVSQALLDVPPGGECTLFFNCPGGSAYSAVSLLSIISTRQLDATGVITGECSSAALWPFAACQKRFVTEYSFCLFHPMKWQSEESVQLIEAAEWTRHFSLLETKMDELLARFFGMPVALLKSWTHPGKYVTGQELVDEGLAEMVDLHSTVSRPAQ